MNSEKKKMHRRRSLGVARAWKRERRLVCRGRATRIWTIREQKEMLDYGRVRGYQGHHLKSVSKYPQYADEPDNIQILRGWVNDNEHLRAHGGDYRNDTESVYSINTGRLMPLPPGKPRLVGSYELPYKAIEKYGYTQYARGNAQSAPQKKNTQVQYGGKTYSRDMVRTGGKKGTGTASPKAGSGNSSPKNGTGTSNRGSVGTARQDKGAQNPSPKNGTGTSNRGSVGTARQDRGAQNPSPKNGTGTSNRGSVGTARQDRGVQNPSPKNGTGTSNRGSVGTARQDRGAQNRTTSTRRK